MARACAADGFFWTTNDVQSDFTHPTSDGGVPQSGAPTPGFFQNRPDSHAVVLEKTWLRASPPSPPLRMSAMGWRRSPCDSARTSLAAFSQVVWTFDNGEFSLLQNPTNIIFRSPGIYTARVAVTGSNSNTASSSVTVHVSTTFDDWRTNINFQPLN